MNTGESSVIILLEFMLITAHLLMYNRSHPTIAKHLWIMSKLLTMKEHSIDGPKINPINLSERLLRYIIATCYPKMIRRLGHRTLSQPYIDSLSQVTTFQFDKSQLDQATVDEIENDQLFLLQFLLPAAPMLRTKIPKLTEQAKLAQNRKPVQFYTKDTCAEFHKLLIELLLRFKTSLDELKEARGDAKVPTRGSAVFKQKVALVMLCGYALQRLAKGAALRAHLKTIAPLLRNWKVRVSMPAPGEEPEELDEDLKAVQPFVSIEGVEISLWRSYIDYLRLIVAHFDVVNILVDYITGPKFQHNAISIQILVSPPVENHLLPWRELFTDSTLFPNETIRNPLSAKVISNADILEFLNNALEPAAEAKAIRALWNKKNFKATTSRLQTLESSTVSGWGECAKKLLVKLKRLEGLPESARDTVFREISDNIQSLWESTKFFSSLGDAQ